MSGQRRAAAIVAALAWAAVILLLAHQVDYAGGSVLRAAWQDLGFFTDLGNLFVAVVFTGIALGSAPLTRPYLVGQALTAILLVALIYWTIGHGWKVFGTVGPGDVLAHAVTPLAVLVFWLVAWPKGGFRWRNALQWAAFPLVYLGYALIRGAATGWYPYPWMAVPRVGYPAVASFAGIVTIVFAAMAALVIALDRLLARRG